MTTSGIFDSGWVADPLRGRETYVPWRQPVFDSSYFRIVESDALNPDLSGDRSFAIAANDLNDGDELTRVCNLAKTISNTGLILVVGRNAENPFRARPIAILRQELENLGAIFVERPPEADSIAKLAVYLDRHYSPDPEALRIALQPAAPIEVRADARPQAYFEPPSEDVEIGADQYFVSHRS